MVNRISEKASGWSPWCDGDAGDDDDLYDDDDDYDEYDDDDDAGVRLPRWFSEKAPSKLSACEDHSWKRLSGKSFIENTSLSHRGFLGEEPSDGMTKGPSHSQVQNVVLQDKLKR